MQPQPEGAPTLRIRVDVGSCDDHPSQVDEESADLRLLGGGRLRARRGEDTVHYMLPTTPPAEDLLHPYIAPAAALFWRWAGREAIHAGALALPRGAVLVLGNKEAGKSTTLAWLSESAGVEVLADDLVVLDGNRVLAGPRSIDLRDLLYAPTAAATSVRRGGRSRLTLPSAPAAVPLAGVAVLEWGPRLDVTHIPLSQRWSVIGAQRMYPGLGADALSLLELVAAPAYRFRRHASPAHIDEVGRAILATFG